MEFNAFKDHLSELYQGEVIGEVLFNELLQSTRDPTHRYKLAVMLQLETETKARLRPALLELGGDLAETEASRALGQEMAAGLRGKEWKEVMAALLEGIRPYVDRYKEIAAGAPSEYRSVAESMVRHEQSLYDCAAMELSDEVEHSLDAIVTQLRFPLPVPK